MAADRTVTPSRPVSRGGVCLWLKAIRDLQLPWRYVASKRRRPIMYWLSRLIDRLVPKDPNLFVIEQRQGGDIDNIVACLRANRPAAKIFSIEQLKRVSRFQRIRVYTRAKTLILTHTDGRIGSIAFSSRKTVIQIWHGSPLKTLAYATPDEDVSQWQDLRRCTAFIVASKLEAAMIAYCFHVHARKIRLLGRPRNDQVFAPGPDAPLVEDFPGPLPVHDKLILLCPTFRNRARFERGSRLIPLEGFEPLAMNDFLERHRAVLLVRGHYLRAQFEPDGGADLVIPEQCDRIVELGFDRCANICSVLSRIDLLVTDYSSIYFDFLLLNRPMIFTPYDLEEYQKRRGLLYDDYDFWTPGPKVDTFNLFLEALPRGLDGDDGYEPQRVRLNGQFNTYQTGDTSRQILELIEKLNRQV